MNWKKEPWSNPEAAQCGLDGDRPGFPRRESLAKHDAAGLLDGATRHRGLLAGNDRLGRQVADRPRGRSRQDLAELGYGPDKPLKMELRYNSGENHKNTAVAIQEQLRPLGIEVSLLNTDTKTHYEYLEHKGDYDVARAGWIADYKDPETFLGISAKASGNNHSSYDQPGIRG